MIASQHFACIVEGVTLQQQWCLRYIASCYLLQRRLPRRERTMPLLFHLAKCTGAPEEPQIQHIEDHPHPQ